MKASDEPKFISQTRKWAYILMIAGLIVTGLGAVILHLPMVTTLGVILVAASCIAAVIGGVIVP